MAEVATAEILDAGEFRGFWISWDNGKISVGKEGQDVSFLEYTDPDPFGIGYYGVCTGWGASGTWLIEGTFYTLNPTVVARLCLHGLKKQEPRLNFPQLTVVTVSLTHSGQFGKAVWNLKFAPLAMHT